MKSLLIGIFVFGLFVAGATGAWVAMNLYAPGNAGTPVRAGIVSNGQPDQCTNDNFGVRARQSAERRIVFERPGLVRGTFEAHGGFGRVDALLRVKDPQGLEIYVSQRSDTADFTFSVPIRGEYVFVFDNTYSLYTSKSIGLFYCIDTGRVPGVAPFLPAPP